MQFMYNNQIYGDIAALNKVVSSILLETNKILDEDLQFDLRLILNELLINCHKHGNRGDCDKAIILYLAIDRRQVDIRVQDEGNGVGQRGDYNVNDLNPNGRGLLLIEGLVDEIKYENNKIRCMIRRTPVS